MRKLVFSTIKSAGLFFLAAILFNTQSPAQHTRTRIAVIGLDHDHVWGLLKDIANEPQAELLAIADPRPDLVDKAKSQVPTSVRFYSDYVQMLDDAKPEAVFVTTENDHHLAILRE